MVAKVGGGRDGTGTGTGSGSVGERVGRQIGRECGRTAVLRARAEVAVMVSCGGDDYSRPRWDGGGGSDGIKCGLGFGWRTGCRGVERRTGDNGDWRASRRRWAGAVAAQGDQGLEERRGEQRRGGEAVDWPVGRQRGRGRRGEAAPRIGLKGLALGSPVDAGWFLRLNARGTEPRGRRCPYAFFI
jgi:hypothetical protein